MSQRRAAFGGARPAVLPFPTSSVCPSSRASMPVVLGEYRVQGLSYHWLEPGDHWMLDGRGVSGTVMWGGGGEGKLRVVPHFCTGFLLDCALNFFRCTRVVPFCCVAVCWRWCATGGTHGSGYATGETQNVRTLPRASPTPLFFSFPTHFHPPTVSTRPRGIAPPHPGVRLWVQPRPSRRKGGRIGDSNFPTLGAITLAGLSHHRQ